MLFTIPAIFLASVSLVASAPAPAPAVTASNCQAGQEFVAKNGTVAAYCNDCTNVNKYAFNSVTQAQNSEACHFHRYARFAGYDCDSIDHNTFYGSFPDWANVPGAKQTSGNEILRGSGDSEGQCERYCLNTFPDTDHTDGSFAGFVYVPDNSVIYGGSAFQCYCKSGQSPSILWKSNERSCSLLGSCQEFTDSGYIAASEAFGGGVPITCEDVRYSNVALPGQSCFITADLSMCSDKLVIA